MALNGMSPSELLAASCYARGLWSPVLVWRAISNKPYHGSPIQWGLDRDLISRHLRRATLIAASFTIFYALLLWAFIETFNPWVAFALLLALFLQWTLVPWVILRLGWVKGKRYDGGNLDFAPTTRLLCKDSTSALPDLGYLLREATFSVDSACREAMDAGEAELDGTPDAEEFYDAVSEAAAKIPSFRVRPLTIVTSAETQPGADNWGPWYRTRYSSMPDGSENVTRLVILGEQASVDGFASAEFMVQEVKPHLSFLLRLRWMPPLQKWHHGLGFLAEQRTWWRAGLLPGLFLSILLLGYWLAGRIGNFTARLVPDYVPYVPLLLVGLQGLLFVAVVLVAFGPIVVLVLDLLYRLARFIWGAIHALTGTHFAVNAPNSFRYLSTRRIFESGDEFQWGIACSQVTQEVITNCIVGVLRKYGIDTHSIKDEVRTFINEGVYMTGGSIAAENIAVGRLARIMPGSRINKARSGKRSLVVRAQKAA
jgi:hypothetical protein